MNKIVLLLSKVFYSWINNSPWIKPKTLKPKTTNKNPNKTFFFHTEVSYLLYKAKFSQSINLLPLYCVVKRVYSTEHNDSSLDPVNSAATEK